MDNGQGTLRRAQGKQGTIDKGQGTMENEEWRMENGLGTTIYKIYNFSFRIYNYSINNVSLLVRSDEITGLLFFCTCHTFLYHGEEVRKS